MPPKTYGLSGYVDIEGLTYFCRMEEGRIGLGW